MASWEGKTRGGVTGYRIFAWTLRYAGLSFAYFVLYFVAFYFVFNSGKAFTAISGFYRHRLHYGFFRALISVYRNYNRFGQILLDKVALMAGFNRKFTFDFEGEEYLRAMKTGGLLVSAHLGNWEIAGQMLNRLEKKVHVILFDAEHQQIKGYLNELMTNRNVHFIVIRDDFSHLLEIRDAFAHGDIVAMHGDRFIPGNKIVMVDFLGEPAPFPVGPFNLAARFGVPVSIVFALKESKTHYHFYASPPVEIPRPAGLKARETILHDNVVRYAAQVETMVRQYPLQWFNYYNFWEFPENKEARPQTNSERATQ